MPSELNLTEAGLSSHSSSFDLKRPGTRASITPRAEFSGLFLTGPANGMLPKPLTDLSRLEKLFYFVKKLPIGRKSCIPWPRRFIFWIGGHFDDK